MDNLLSQSAYSFKNFFSSLISLDENLFETVNSLAGRWEKLDMAGIFLAKYLIYILIVAVFLIFWKKWRTILLAFLAGALARFGIVELMQEIYPRVRPFVENNVHLLIDKLDQPAFPSGHAAFTFALSGVVYFYNKKAGFAFLAASFLISISRVFVGVHWPLDVLAGALAGIFSAWLVIKIFKKF